VARDLQVDLAQPGHPNGGSYFGFKELGRLATIAELAAQVDKVAPGAKNCPQLLRRIYGAPGSKQRRELGELVRTLEVEGVDATARADTVLLSWSAEAGGRRVAVKQPVLRVDGRWQLVSSPSVG
jgi:hypothetical protein